MRGLLFPDMLDPANMNFDQFAIEASQKSYADKYYANLEYNQFVELVYERVNFGVILPFFVLFFIAGYLFYGALFAAIGATMGTESDGQQFVIPLVLMKAAIVCEMQEDYKSALKYYERIESDFGDSREAADVEKYIAKIEAKMAS